MKKQNPIRRRSTNGSRGYINVGAIPSREYNPGNQKADAASQRIKKTMDVNRSKPAEGRVCSTQPVKMQPKQLFRQDRPSTGKLFGTGLGWRRKHTATRQSGHDNHR